jgi:hypothetical protein
MHFWNNVGEYPLTDLFSLEGQAQYGRSFDYLLGEPIEWQAEKD